jgi:cupin fold WbuC family metalloprotein
MKIINNALLNELTEKASESERLRMNHNFHDSNESKSQRLLNALEPGTVIPLHKHDNTAETYIVLRGSIRVDFYNSVDSLGESAVIDPLEGNYGIDIPAGQLHTLEVLKNGTVIFECKDGPYIPINTSL